MSLNPIYKVLSTFYSCQVESLLIGGQACILYGAAEFSRDTDFVVLCDITNLENIKKALKILKANRIYVPPLDMKYLTRGHACHFKCYDEEVKGLRIDILSKMKGCADFEELWKRRTTVRIDDRNKIEVIGLKDLVASKKTQRDKDWLMLARLVDNDILTTKNPDKEKIKWWLFECRSIDVLAKLCKKYNSIAKDCVKIRPLLKYLLTQNKKKAIFYLKKEEITERQKDKEYWLPLRKELEILRHRKI